MVSCLCVCLLLQGSYYNGMLVTATVARNCGEMELFVMRAYDCFDDCDEIGSLPGLFHGSGAISRQRRLGQVHTSVVTMHCRRALH